MEQMERLAAEDPALAHNRSLLDSIPGIGALTALLLLAELPALDSFESARQLCAYAGLTPRERQSGTSVHGRTRLCKQGRGGLRSLLFLPAASLRPCVGSRCSSLQFLKTLSSLFPPLSRKAIRSITSSLFSEFSKPGGMALMGYFARVFTSLWLRTVS